MQPASPDLVPPAPPRPVRHRRGRYLAWGVLMLAVVLLLPDRNPRIPAPASKQPFVWDQDQFWVALEGDFKAARGMNPDLLLARIDTHVSQVDRLLDSLGKSNAAPDDPLFGELETNLFQLAPWVAAAPSRLNAYSELILRTRTVTKEHSIRWDMSSAVVRQRLYRLLYGGRAALEEVVLQADSKEALGATIYLDESLDKATSLATANSNSEVPSLVLHGVRVHSGDILVSRGGAATSALIARGNDYPGNFSHIALAHVDAQSQRAAVAESHIESGVGITPIDDYFRDKKLRIMLLRLRPDLPALRADPLLPHRAASFILAEARRRHIPYDFTMDHRDHTEQFCSEVAAFAYESVGMQLWMGLSHLSGRGVTTWLGLLGARHFETQEPADLEYDPQLRVVAEWRDPSALFHDHVDNAILDVMLEGAERGETLPYDWYLLPFARLSKGYSLLLNFCGRIGPVPEGMNATAALRTKRFTARHAALKERVLAQAKQFQNDFGYRPPYWELTKLARAAAVEHR